MNHFLKDHIPWIVWGLLIIVLVSIPGDDLPELSKSFDWLKPDKLTHVLLLLVFVILFLRGFDHHYANHNIRKNLYFYALLAGILLSGGTEILQHFCIPGRTATLKDFLFNTLGCVIGWLVYTFWRKKAHFL